MNNERTPADNERFGATAAGSADLKGSAEMPPLRQAAIPLRASVESVVDKVSRLEKCVQSDKGVELSTVPTTNYKPTKQWN
jgi:hypothetical protein